jgi:hypothetical protein
MLYQTPNSKELIALDAELVAVSRFKGAYYIVINGAAISNAGFLNPRIAAKFGYAMVPLRGGGITLFKAIK